MEQSKQPEQFPKFRSGVYRHYKGQLYLAIGLARDANYENRTGVVYVGLELDAAKPGPRINFRTYEDFYEWVNPETRQVARPNSPGSVPRFEFLGNTPEG